MRKLLTRLFQRRCPICKTEVRSGSEGAVCCFGQWCCSQPHAEAYACSLYKALDEFQRHHTARHGVYVLRLMAPSMDIAVSGASEVGQERQSRCGIWFVSCRGAGCL
jgi:hypothetical protein